LIDQLDIDISGGFSVITGETGAGKSIMMGALALLLGTRADAKVIKHGASKCCVEAEFDVAKLNIVSLFEENDIDFDGSELIVRREVTANGKSRAFVNDSPVTLPVLKEIASRIIDVHSQHQNLLMGDENFILGILDAVSSEPTPKILYSEAFEAWHEAQKEYVALKEKAEKDQQDSEYLLFQLKQLEDADLKEGEQEALEEELEILSHAEEIKQALYKVSSGFQSEGNNPISFLRSSIQTLRRIDSVFPIAGSLAERLDSVQIELEDVSGELENSLERVEYDPKRQEIVDERLNLLYTLQRKHNVQGEKELLALKESLRERVDTIENIGDILLQKEKEVCRLSDEMNKLGEQLTALRKAAAKIIEERLVECLHSLGMPNVSVALNLFLRPSPDVTGLDNVEFLFSANKNVQMQEVAKIASGGEIARLMLALKSIISHVKHLPTIVFDEIDTGVSGTMAEKMALVMQDMASDCQVLCITHLPQIAALGHWHYRVSKQETSNGTTSHIKLLTEEERVLEIANMLSGEQLTDAAINNAKSLLKYDK
jgi:DNA repair protein RecN (Recombination protein N)